MKMTINSRRVELLGLAILMLSVAAASAGTEKNVEINGFLLGNFSGRTTGLRPDANGGSDFLLAEERLRLDIYAWSEYIEASARIKGDFFHDAITGEFEIDLREAYVDYTEGAFDFRLGRQIATWGVGDLLFINDVFPKDWVSFFSGRLLEYLKIGTDGFRVQFSSRAVNTELLIIPFFQPDIVPSSRNFFIYDPFEDVQSREETKPEATYNNTELALRLYGKIMNFDISIYAYNGFWGTPSMRPDDFGAPTRAISFYPELAVFGLSAQGSSLDGILSFETGYYYSGEDKNGVDPTIPNSEARFLLGYQRQFWEDFTAGIQYYGEIMGDYTAYKMSLPVGFPSRKEYRDTATLRLERLLKHQIWRLSLFTFYSPADNDYLIQPQTSYKLSDNFNVALGANIFGGEKNSTFLTQFDKNDNVYLSVRFDF